MSQVERSRDPETPKSQGSREEKDWGGLAAYADSANWGENVTKEDPVVSVDDPDGVDAVDPKAEDWATVAAAETLAEARSAAAKKLTVNSTLLFLIWGIAWAIGYLGMHLTGGQGLGLAVFGALLFVAIVFTAWHIAQRVQGLGGESSRTGMLILVGWGLGFMVVFAAIPILTKAMGAGLLLGVVINTLACLVVGLQYLATAIAYREKALGALGIWILIIAEISCVFPEWAMLIMAVLGGGGFLVGAVVARIWGR